MLIEFIAECVHGHCPPFYERRRLLAGVGVGLCDGFQRCPPFTSVLISIKYAIDKLFLLALIRRWAMDRSFLHFGDLLLKALSRLRTSFSRLGVIHPGLSRLILRTFMGQCLSSMVFTTECRLLTLS